MHPQRRMTLSTFALLGLTTLLAWSGLVMPTAQARRGSSMEQANKAVARRYYEEIFNQGNLAAIDELVAPDLVAHGPGVAPRAEGTSSRDRLRQAVTGLRTTWPDLHLTIEDEIAEGDKVAVRYTRRGTQKGEWHSILFGTVPPTGKEVTFTGVTIFRLVNGKIAEIWLNPDELGMVQQLGLIPPAPPAAARP
jgi:predicted ester cyclase